MTASNLLTVVTAVVFGGGCALLVASHVTRIYFRRVRREAIDENNEPRAVWADKKVNSGSWSLGAIGLALAIFGLLFLMTVSRSVSLAVLGIGAGSTFGVMCLLRAWDVLHPTEPRRDGWRAQVATGMSNRRPAKAAPEKVKTV